MLQGSILNVIVFAVAINGTVGVLIDGVHSSLYADLSFSLSAARMSLIGQKLQFAIDTIANWANTLGFSFSSYHKSHTLPPL